MAGRRLLTGQTTPWILFPARTAADDSHAVGWGQPVGAGIRACRRLTPGGACPRARPPTRSETAGTVCRVRSTEAAPARRAGVRKRARGRTPGRGSPAGRGRQNPRTGIRRGLGSCFGCRPSRRDPGGTWSGVDGRGRRARGRVRLPRTASHPAAACREALRVGCGPRFPAFSSTRSRILSVSFESFTAFTFRHFAPILLSARSIDDGGMMVGEFRGCLAFRARW